MYRRKSVFASRKEACIFLLKKGFYTTKIEKGKKKLLTGEDQYNCASPEQKQLIWLCQEGLSKIGKYIGVIDQYNISGTKNEYYKFNNFRKHNLRLVKQKTWMV